MKKWIKLLSAAIAIATMGLLAPAPAHATACNPQFEQICETTVRIICQVVAKGRPCLG